MTWKQREPIIKYKKKDTIIEKLAKIRGVKDLDSFLNPKKDFLHSPYLLKNIEEASNRIIKAIHKEERIVVSADCDSDGIFSTAIMVNFLKQFTSNIDFIYNQRSKGHGIEQQIDFIPDDTDLLIILDSSTNSTKECKRIQEKEIEIIILDHHEFIRKNPYATIVNPQLDDYPNKKISGAGVTFKTIQVIDDTLLSETSWDFIDLCGMGMYADMMDMSVPENRYIVHEAMENIENLGLKCILELKGKELDEVDTQTIGFTISPLINGMARLDKIEMTFQLLMSDNYMECSLLAKEMLELNEERKYKQRKLVHKYTKDINDNKKYENKIIVATDKSASKNFNGVVANDLAERYQRPVLVLRDHKGSISGSYRSYADFNMSKFLSQFPYVTVQGGHAGAGGVTFFKKDLEKFIQESNEKLSDKDFEASFEYDIELNVDDIDKELIEEVWEFNRITGKGFPQAKFKITGVITDERKVLGKNRDTIKISSDELDFIKFKTTEFYAEDVGDMVEIEAIGQLDINKWQKWNGEVIETNQCILDDYKVIKKL